MMSVWKEESNILSRMPPITTCTRTANSSDTLFIFPCFQSLLEHWRMVSREYPPPTLSHFLCKLRTVIVLFEKMWNLRGVQRIDGWPVSIGTCTALICCCHDLTFGSFWGGDMTWSPWNNAMEGLWALFYKHENVHISMMIVVHCGVPLHPWLPSVQKD